MADNIALSIAMTISRALMTYWLSSSIASPINKIGRFLYYTTFNASTKTNVPFSVVHLLRQNKVMFLHS